MIQEIESSLPERGRGGEAASTSRIFLIFLRLGLTSFGGPIAHLGYFREEFVNKRRWMDASTYAGLVSLCQFLPGPASSQVGMAIGLGAGGLRGALAAWAGFTLPSALALVAFALAISHHQASLGSGWLQGLKIVSVAIVAQALLAMGKTSCPDRVRASIAIAAMALALWIPSSVGQISAIFGGGLLGYWLLPTPTQATQNPLPRRVSPRLGLLMLGLWLGLLLILPVINQALNDAAFDQWSRFYRTGSLVFGGGHVVLPLLEAELLPRGWISEDLFLAGYGAAQAVPGPLFSLAAYVGAISKVEPAGWVGAALCLTAIFLPSLLLVAGVLPFWERLRTMSAMQRCMLGINAAVLGLLLAAFFHPVWTSSIHGAKDFSIAALAFLLLVFWNIRPWIVVGLTSLVCGLLAQLGQ